FSAVWISCSTGRRNLTPSSFHFAIIARASRKLTPSSSINNLAKSCDFSSQPKQIQRPGGFFLPSHVSPSTTLTYKWPSRLQNGHRITYSVPALGLAPMDSRYSAMSSIFVWVLVAFQLFSDVAGLEVSLQRDDEPASGLAG